MRTLILLASTFLALPLTPSSAKQGNVDGEIKFGATSTQTVTYLDCLATSVPCTEPTIVVEEEDCGDFVYAKTPVRIGSERYYAALISIELFAGIGEITEDLDSLSVLRALSLEVDQSPTVAAVISREPGFVATCLSGEFETGPLTVSFVQSHRRPILRQILQIDTPVRSITDPWKIVLESEPPDKNGWSVETALSEVRKTLGNFGCYVLSCIDQTQIRLMIRYQKEGTPITLSRKRTRFVTNAEFNLPKDQIEEVGLLLERGVLPIQNCDLEEQLDNSRLYQC